MAKLHAVVAGIDFDATVDDITRKTLERSMTSSSEGAFDETFGDTKCAIRTIERYSIFGDNRVSMTIVFVQHGDEPIHIMATSSGGGAGPVKLFAWGESSFLETLQKTLEDDYHDKLASGIQADYDAWSK